MINTDFKTLADFLTFFKDEDTCKKYFEDIRFKGGDYCAHCRHNKIHRFSDGKRYRCASCNKDFTIKTNTIFGESKINLRTWFIAIYILTTRKKGVSSIELAQQLGVSQKTAWFIDHRLREALKQNKNKLKDCVEVDETYMGGKEKNKHWDKRTKGTQGRSVTTKTPIMGIIQRGGEVRATVVDRVSVANVEKQIFDNVALGTTIYTDDFLGYKNLSKYFNHASVSHGKSEYVRGDVHSNSAESFWALFKRGYYGTYHTISKKHLQRYVDEFAFRFNHRILSVRDRFNEVVNRITTYDKISYKQLTYGKTS